MKRLILFIFVYGLLIAKDRVYVIYGTQPEKALSVRYIDNQKKGFFKQILKEGFTVKETENIPLG